MKNSFPTMPIVELLSVKEEKAILFTPLTKEQFVDIAEHIRAHATIPKTSPKKKELEDEFKKCNRLSFNDILGIGDTKIETRLANSYMEATTMNCSGTIKRNFKCFVFKNWRENNITNNPMHQDGSCSWNCLMTKLHHPQYGIVYTVPLDMLHKFNIYDTN